MIKFIKDVARCLAGNGYMPLFVLLACMMQVMPLFFKSTSAAQKLLIWIPVLTCFIFYKKTINLNLKRLSSLGFLYIFLYVFYSVIGASGGTFSSNLACIMYIFPILCIYLIYNYGVELQVKYLFHILALFTVLNIADSIRYSILYPVSTYQLMAGYLEHDGITGLNIGGGPFVNMSVFFLMVCMISYFKTNNKVEKVLFAIYSIITLYFTIFCSFKGSVIIFTFTAVCLLIIVNKARQKSTAIVFTLIASALFYIYKEGIIHGFVDFLGSDKIAARLLLFADTDNAEADAATLTSRSELWLVSLRTWLQNPITFLFGIGNHLRSDTVSTAATGIGNHSDFCDVLARFGIIGWFVFFGIIKKLYDFCLDCSNNKYIMDIKVFFFIILLFCLTKKIEAANVAISLFVMFPLCLIYFSNVDKE